MPREIITVQVGQCGNQSQLILTPSQLRLDAITLFASPPPDPLIHAPSSAVFSWYGVLEASLCRAWHQQVSRLPTYPRPAYSPTLFPV